MTTKAQTRHGKRAPAERITNKEKKQWGPT